MCFVYHQLITGRAVFGFVFFVVLCWLVPARWPLNGLCTDPYSPMHGQLFAAVITNVGDPRLVSSSPLPVTNCCYSCPIDIAYPCQVTGKEIGTATKFLEKACHNLWGIPEVPLQRINDLDNATTTTSTQLYLR